MRMKYARKCSFFFMWLLQSRRLLVFSGPAKVCKHRGSWELLHPKARGSFATLYSQSRKDDLF